MADIHIERSHNFDFATARGKAKSWLESAKKDLGLDVVYQEGENADTASVSIDKMGGIKGCVTLTAEKIIFEAELGLLAKAFKGNIVEGIQAGLDKYLSDDTKNT